MKTYPENYDVTIVAAFTDYNGDLVAPTAVKAALYDGEDELVVDFGSLPFTPGDTSKNIVIPAEFNVLGAGELKAARILRTTLETAAGDIERSSSYIIRGDVRLAIMQNSFCSLEAAEMVAEDIPHLTGWKTAEDEDRFAALITAFNRLTRIPMRFRSLEQVNPAFSSCDTETVILSAAWPTIDAAEFLTYPIHFRKAVRLAQVLEANELLENDATVKRHRMGIISETVGESSMMLRGGKIELGVSTRAVEALRGFIYYNFRLARA